MHHCSLSPEEATKLYHLSSAITWILWSNSKISNYILFSSTPNHLGHARFQQHSKTGEEEISPLVSPHKIWNVGHLIQFFPSWVGFFSYLFNAELGRTTASKCVLVQTFAFVYSDTSPHTPAICPFLPALRFRQDKNQSLSSPMKSLQVLYMF